MSVQPSSTSTSVDVYQVIVTLLLRRANSYGTHSGASHKEWSKDLFLAYKTCLLSDERWEAGFESFRVFILGVFGEPGFWISGLASVWIWSWLQASAEKIAARLSKSLSLVFSALPFRSFPCPIRPIPRIYRAFPPTNDDTKT